MLRRFRAWARSHREGDGPDRLAADAVDLLVGFGLVTVADDGTVDARPALARYRVGEPVVTGTAQASMFEEGPMTESLTVAARGSPPTGGGRPGPGIVNLWRYWDETFTFHHGRLLLRGPNGSGKSMALELLLPFLLDADASPGRLTSAAKSRGGLFERVMTGTDETSRAGLRLGRVRAGATRSSPSAPGSRASASTRKVDLDLLHHVADGRHRAAPARRAPGAADPQGPRRARSASHGRVHASGHEHRAAVREALFPGFGPDRYDSVITALLALRKEKLSQNLDLAKLSEVLSDALPPLDEHDLAAVAEGFERLDRRRGRARPARGGGDRGHGARRPPASLRPRSCWPGRRRRPGGRDPPGRRHPRRAGGRRRARHGPGRRS